MKTEQEIRVALKKCYCAMHGPDRKLGKCWLSHRTSMCFPEECSTIPTLAWVLEKEVDYCSEDFLAKYFRIFGGLVQYRCERTWRTI